MAHVGVKPCDSLSHRGRVAPATLPHGRVLLRRRRLDMALLLVEVELPTRLQQPHSVLGNDIDNLLRVALCLSASWPEMPLVRMSAVARSAGCRLAVAEIPVHWSKRLTNKWWRRDSRSNAGSFTNSEIQVCSKMPDPAAAPAVLLHQTSAEKKQPSRASASARCSHSGTRSRCSVDFPCRGTR